MATVVYTDGACSGNPGPGGWAWAVPDGGFRSGAAPDTTNQRMELAAVLDAVTSFAGPLHVISDSTYVVNCFRDRWYEGWLRRGWVNSQKKPVANRDLWEPLIDEVLRRGDVTFEWVKGHAGNEWNDLADRLAVEAAHLQAGREGDEPPDDVLVPDRTAPAAAASPGTERDPTGREPPPGHRLVVLGLRAHELDEVVANGSWPDKLRRLLTDIVSAKAQMHDELIVLTGLRQGAEAVAAEAAIDAGVPHAAVLPFPEPELRWPAIEREGFRELRDAAAEVIVLQNKVPDDTKGVVGALGRRDSWFLRNGHEAILIWDHEHGSLVDLAKKLDKAWGDDVWIVDPTEL